MKELFRKPSSELSEDKYKSLIFNYFVGILCVLTLATALYDTYLSLIVTGETAQAHVGYAVDSFISILVWGFIWLGHRWYPKITRHFFLIFMIVAVIFFFNLEDRFIFVILTVPIFMSAFLIKPFYSFVYLAFAGCIYLFNLYLSIYSTDNRNDYLNLMTLVIVATVAWFIARSLEHALTEVRTLNKELDRRVQERTKELAAAVRREHALAERNKIILESIADGVLVFDTKEQIIMANPAANYLANRNLYSLNLKDFLNMVNSHTQEIIRKWMSDKKPNNIDNVRFELDKRTISANIAPVMLPGANNGRIGDGYVMVWRDFSKEAELEKAKDVFLGMVSHELRTPMTSIQGYVDILLAMKEDDITKYGRDYLETINVNIKQLLKLANELIDLSRMETGEIELYCQWVNPGDIVASTAKIVRQEFTKRNLTLDIKTQENIPELFVDRNRINQVLLNILSNAYKYTSQGGATVEIYQSETWVYIIVRDTGVGITQADQEKLFQRFFRANDTKVQKADGTGLGLSISKGLIELHNGKLTCQSEYGQGTTFTISLPKNNAAPTQTADLAKTSNS